jgi:hypothetical protein
MPMSQSDTSRAYCRGVMLCSDFGAENRNSPGFLCEILR